ncbi:MAG: hypothetical protein K2X39_05335, partial [Silvanigrellaceae bacterium]|nr:hypothetical protein [Silvanigrellaceae bacterium]
MNIFFQNLLNRITFVFLLLCLLTHSPALKAFGQTNELTTTRPRLEVEPVALDWKSFEWPALEYNRSSLKRGAALYELPNAEVLKFEIVFLFSGGVYTTPKEKRQVLLALSSLLLLGGTKNFSYEELTHYMSKEGINLNVNTHPKGSLMLTASGLSDDFEKVINLVNEVLVSPRWETQALSTWKELNKNRFLQFIQGNTSGQQMTFVQMESMKQALGKDNHLTTYIERLSPKINDSITYEEVKSLAKEIITTQGLQVVLIGKYPLSAPKEIARVVHNIPNSDLLVPIWSPGKTTLPPQKKIKAIVISKPDMTQNILSLAYYFPTLGKLS